MNILLIGSGGREHALAWKIAASPLCDMLFIAPGNPGAAQCGTIVAMDVGRHDDVIEFCVTHDVGLVVIGPEGPLVAGLTDDLEAAGIKAFGPSREAARLEGSKSFTKALCSEAGIPTASYARFTALEPALAHVYAEGAPIVVKADGLAAGKGVVVAMTIEEAEDALDMMFAGELGEAGASVVIEEMMRGEEASFFALCDGRTALALGSAQDHKRVGEGDVGPNTGGMGAYSPAPAMTPEMEERVMREIIRPTVALMAQRGTPFRGVLFAGLMLTEDGPKLIEYNARFGDPECQVLMPRLRSDIVALMLAACDGALGKAKAEWFDIAALAVVLCGKGYPGAPEKGGVIAGVEEAAALDGVLAFHAGTTERDGALIANGGRVLNLVGLGDDLAEARRNAYAAVDLIRWEDGFCRRDIGWRALGPQEVK
jgi:phosphoribosylamine--glycine ligase